MTTSTAEYLGSLSTRLTHTKSSVKIVTDAPTDNNGKGESFSPTDLCATSLASCIITIMGIKANSLSVELGKVKADIYKVMGSSPRRIVEVKVVLNLFEKHDEKTKQILEFAGLNCPVAKSLHPDINQNIEFVWH